MNPGKTVSSPADPDDDPNELSSRLNRKLRMLIESGDLDRFWYRVAELFVKGVPAKQISVQIAREMGYSVGLTHENVYELVRKLFDRGLAWFAPPRHTRLEASLRAKYAGIEGRHVEVVDGTEMDPVPVRAALHVHRLIHQLAGPNRDRPVHLALGVGRSVQMFARALAARLRSDPKAPHVVLHAMAPSYDLGDPLETPITFFTYFMDVLPRPGFVSFQGVPVVRADEYGAVRRGPVVAEAFEAASQVQIVVTSMASSADEHGYLLKYERRYGDGRRGETWLLEAGWIGDLHLRPYSRTGVIVPGDDCLMPLSLFELPDLRRLSGEEGKHVVLLCPPCRQCDKTKAAALQPLLQAEDLRVWNHLFLEPRTAEELLAMPLEPAS